MRRPLGVWLLALVAGCGRVAFDPLGDGGGSGGGGGSDAPRAFAIGQHRSANQTAPNSSTNHVELTLAEATVVGDVLVIGVDTEAVPNQSLVMFDAAGLAFTPVVGPIGDGAILEWLFVAPITSATAGDVIAVDAQVGAPSFLELRVHEIAGLRTDIATAPSAFAHGTASPGDPIATPALAVPPSSLALGFGVAETALDAGAGWSTLELDFDDLVEYQTTTTGGTFTATATDTNGGDWVMSIAALPLQ